MRRPFPFYSLILSAGTLSLALILSGCGKDDTAKPAAVEQAVPAAETPQPAEAAPVQADAAARAVVEHYSDIALAVFSDSLTAAQALQTTVDKLIAEPTDANLQAARAAWLY